MSRNGALNDPVQLRLNDAEQEALTGLLLTLWSSDIEREESGDRKVARRARRNRLRFARRESVPDGRPRQEPTDVESPALLGSLLRSVRTEAHALQLLITACASQPWATMNDRFDGRLDDGVRKRVLTDALEYLPGPLGWDTVEAIDDILYPSVVDRVARGVTSHPIRTSALLGGAALVGVATAGVAAPAIGAAIGAQMGLTGAAASSAGLAAIGGGSIAAGGSGMAGGTTLIASLGGLGGAGLGAMAGTGSALRDYVAQGAQLEALVRVGATLSESTKAMTFDQALLIEIEVGRLVSERARQTDRADTSAFDDEIANTIRLRQRLGGPEFRLS